MLHLDDDDDDEQNRGRKHCMVVFQMYLSQVIIPSLVLFIFIYIHTLLLCILFKRETVMTLDQFRLAQSCTSHSNNSAIVGRFDFVSRIVMTVAKDTLIKSGLRPSVTNSPFEFYK